MRRGLPLQSQVGPRCRKRQECFAMAAAQQYRARAAELLVFALPARPPPEQKEAQRPAIGVFEVVMVFVVVIEPASHCRAVEGMRVRFPVPPTALPLFTLLTRHLLPPRLFAEPSLAVQRLIGAVGCTERSIGFCAGLDVTAA